MNKEKGSQVTDSQTVEPQSVINEVGNAILSAAKDLPFRADAKTAGAKIKLVSILKSNFPDHYRTWLDFVNNDSDKKCCS